MAEYWKSAPRHWCKQCKIFIRDTPFEKTQHEATGKHQGNLKRFLRDIHRTNEHQQRETQRAKSEVERLRSAVSGSPADGASNAAAPWKRAPAAAPAPVEKSVSIEERKKQMAQLAEMGVAIPQEYRGDMALAGEWQTLSEKVVDGASTPSLGVRKRKHEEADEEEEEAKKEAERFVSKPWGSRTRQYPGAQDDTDLDALLASTKDIKKSKPSTSDAPAQGDDKEVSVAPEKGEAETVNPETETDQPSQTKEESLPEAKKEPEEAAGGVVFKKRKPKVMKK
ncbi:hypothetical protein P170DRAFT_461059 [Aspergillus steynii IBT 23096]|uniref:U1-type domain-containing protein n=1 Tax=Aspergillus steynii IBT 23096 TaxID=1392250 RepID=A0A2I2GQF3_9EURO|nr:uncharacterized protein P170DRAFT_461059 [Aspergillus steynii IBT 23096]PLB55112.1 hypothetical protein P170DRAFT_461059 [Aspergillus steynii IBT 23096]